MEHGLNFLLFYVQKHIIAMAMCYNPALVLDKPLGAPASVKLVYSLWYDSSIIPAEHSAKFSPATIIHNSKYFKWMLL